MVIRSGRSIPGRFLIRLNKSLKVQGGTSEGKKYLGSSHKNSIKEDTL